MELSYPDEPESEKRFTINITTTSKFRLSQSRKNMKLTLKTAKYETFISSKIHLN